MEVQTRTELRHSQQLTENSNLTHRLTEWSPRFRARMAGLFYLLESLTSVFGQLVIPGMLVVSGNASATATNILANESLFRLGFALSAVSVVLHVARALLFYQVFKPANRSVSLLALCIILVGCAVLAVTSLLYIAPLVILLAGKSLSGFSTEQLNALAYSFLRLNGQAFNLYLIFFGVYCGLIGYLIFKSTFMPRIIGLLMPLAGLGYLTLLWPPLVNVVYPFNLALAGPGEISLLVWLLVVGVNEQRWKEQASAAIAKD